uniref:Uncharacterized protein n=1 Tax=Myotis myotis TaxID=51298 RepID=A0A7J7TIJ9_MYOMY|nr:hypothetical protein mMyoMyo1_009077 [Myotis myotis]
MHFCMPSTPARCQVGVMSVILNHGNGGSQELLPRPGVMQLAHLSDSSLQVPLSFPYTPSLHPGLCSSATPQGQLLEIDCSVSNSSLPLSVPSPIFISLWSLYHSRILYTSLLVSLLRPSV